MSISATRHLQVETKLCQKQGRLAKLAPNKAARHAQTFGPHPFSVDQARGERYISPPAEKSPAAAHEQA
jgi:hypothetical protein